MNNQESFDTVVVPHLDAGYRLARWLMRNQHDADDAMQEACLRAFRYFRSFVGGDGRAWFLRIVRNTCYGFGRLRAQAPTAPFEEERHSSDQPQADPETLLLQTDEATLMSRALSRLPPHFHQLLVLREVEGLSYRELSEAIGIPIGTVMSRLSRARQALRATFDTEVRGPAAPSPERRSGAEPGRRRLANQLLERPDGQVLPWRERDHPREPIGKYGTRDADAGSPRRTSAPICA